MQDKQEVREEQIFGQVDVCQGILHFFSLIPSSYLWHVPLLPHQPHLGLATQAAMSLDKDSIKNALPHQFALGVAGGHRSHG